MMRYGADFLQRHSHMSVIDFKKTSPASVTKCGNARLEQCIVGQKVHFWTLNAFSDDV